MKRIIVLFIMFLFLFLVSCNNQEISEPINNKTVDNEYVLTIHINDEINEYKTKNTTFEFKDYDSNRYELIGIYLDSEYKDEFDGKVNKNIDLYVKLEKKEYLITIHIGDEVKEYKTKNTTFEFNDYDNNRYELIGVYLDSEYKEEFDGAISDDIDLYVFLKEKKYIDYYINGELVNSITLYSDEQIPDNEIIYNPYYEVSVFSDIDNTQKFNDYNCNTDCSIYYKTVRKEEYEDKVVVNIHSGMHIAHYVLDKGEALSGYLGLGGIYGANYSFTIFVDEECREVYKFGPINSDIDLYTIPLDMDASVTSDYDNYTLFVYYYVLDDKLQMATSGKYYFKGKVVREDSFPLVYNYYISGIYYEPECINEFIIGKANDEKIKLYGKVENEIPEDAHKVTIYLGPKTIEGIDAFDKSTAKVYREFYVRDQARINELRLSDEELCLYYCYYANDIDKPFMNDKITQDTELVILNDGNIFAQKYTNNNKLHITYQYGDHDYYLTFYSNNLPNTYDLGLYGMSFYIDEACTILLTEEVFTEDVKILFVN